MDFPRFDGILCFVTLAYFHISIFVIIKHVIAYIRLTAFLVSKRYLWLKFAFVSAERWGQMHKWSHPSAPSPWWSFQKAFTKVKNVYKSKEWKKTVQVQSSTYKMCNSSLRQIIKWKLYRNINTRNINTRKHQHM